MRSLKRFNHYLPKNANTEIPQRLLFVDTEAKIRNNSDGTISQTLRLGTAIYLRRRNNKWISEREYEFKDIETFFDIIDLLAEDNTKLYIFAHNMAYDYTILKMDTYLSTRNYEITLRSISTAFIILAQRKKEESVKSSLCFVSSTN